MVKACKETLLGACSVGARHSPIHGNEFLGVAIPIDGDGNWLAPGLSEVGARPRGSARLSGRDQCVQCGRVNGWGPVLVTPRLASEVKMPPEFVSFVQVEGAALVQRGVDVPPCTRVAVLKNNKRVLAGASGKELWHREALQGDTFDGHCGPSTKQRQRERAREQPSSAC